MVKYYKLVSDNQVIMVGTGVCGEEISENEYFDICEKIRNKPIAPPGNEYILMYDLSWKIVDSVMELDISNK